MKKKLAFSAIILAIIFTLAHRFNQKAPELTTIETKNPQNVTVQTVKDSLTSKEELTYPATVIGDQEISVTAKASGNAVAVPFNLGDHVYTGSLLARIDSIGNTLMTEYKDFQSSQIQTTHLSKEQAEKSLALAEKNYKNLKKAYEKQEDDDTLAKTVSKTQVDAAKIQISIAELQLKSASVGLKGLLDNYLITSPITGFITEKLISSGDSVSAGQPIATISATKNIKFQFFVDEEHKSIFIKNLEIKIIGNNNQTSTAIVKNISPVADPITKRFLIEAYPKSSTDGNFSSGTLATISLELIRKPIKEGAVLLPLSAITIGQNESYIFIADNDKAKKVLITIDAVHGESAEISLESSPETQIILSGSKLLQDGSSIIIQK